MLFIRLCADNGYITVISRLEDVNILMIMKASSRKIPKSSSSCKEAVSVELPF